MFSSKIRSFSFRFIANVNETVPSDAEFKKTFEKFLAEKNAVVDTKVRFAHI